MPRIKIHQILLNNIEFSRIKNSNKDWIIEIDQGNWKDIQVGDIIDFSSTQNEEVKLEVIDTIIFASILDVLRYLSYKSLKPEFNSNIEVLYEYMKKYPSWNGNFLGFRVRNLN